jgi:hypothetical protein
MQELNLRLGQAVALTYAQTDENFKRLKTAIDALEVSVAGAGLGTVTSVGLTMPNIFTVTNSPVTTTGSLTATLASQSANRIFASPNGAAGQPTFRGLVAADLPTVPINKGGLNLTTVVPINQVLASTGAGYEGRAISVVPFSGLTLTQGTGSIEFSLDPPNINLASLGGVLTVAKGGTGLSAPPANGTLLIGNGVAYTNALLTAGSGISITNTSGAITIAATSAGVSTLNTLSGNLNMLFGTAAAFPAVVTSGSDIQFNIPDAGPSPIVRGLLTAADWTIFNNKLSGSGTTNYIPKFTASGTVGNSVLYQDPGTGNIGIGTITPSANFHILGTGPKSLLVESTNSNANIKVSNTSGFPTSATLTSGGILTTLATNLTVNTGLVVYPIGNVQITKGFAIADLQYFNIPGNTAFTSNEQYGIILGPGSDATITVQLPLNPINGQEVCILIEENKTLTVASGVVGRLIYGQAAVAGVTVVLSINLNTHGSVYIFKFSQLGNGGVGGGAWYLTGY